MGTNLEDGYLASITVRVSFELIKQLDPICGKQKGKKFTDKSAAIRYYIERGQQFESLLEIYNDPEKRKEFEAQLSNISKEQNLEQQFETFDDNFLRAIIFTAKNKLDSRVQQLIFDLK